MNSTGCEPGWAKDEFVYSTALLTTTSECTVNIAFFNAFLSILILIQLANFVITTHGILQRARQRKLALLFGQYQTIASCFCTLVAVLLLIILPNTIGTEQNSMLCLVGIILFLFNINLSRRTEKIRRLGTRLIMKRLPETKHTLSRINPNDRLVTGLVSLGYLICVVEFVFICIIAVILYQDAHWPQVSIGLNAAFLCIICACAVHQTEQCRRAVRDTTKQVRNMLNPQTLVKYSQVQAKFRNQMLVYVLFGSVGATVCILAAIGVIPIDHRLLLTAVGFDATGTLAMLLSTAMSCLFTRRESSDKVANSPTASSKPGLLIVDIGDGNGSKVDTNAIVVTTTAVVVTTALPINSFKEEDIN
ncbi:hypothetical protein BASA81_000308 [Batrachochytrium salamandrivorans]|nr:hypothetical protein BASA81_000308 [Batrachochytrium salamandrivorans]